MFLFCKKVMIFGIDLFSEIIDGEHFESWPGILFL